MAKLSRTVALSGAPLPSAQELRWSDKDPGDTLDYKFDATSFNVDNGGDTIVQDSVTLASSPGDTTATLTGCDGNVLTWTIAGGTQTSPITDYGFGLLFSTTGGRTIRRTIWLRVRDLSPNESFPVAVSIIGGITEAQLTAALQGQTQLIQAGDASLQGQITAVQLADADFVSNEMLSAGLLTETTRAQGAEGSIAFAAMAAVATERSRALTIETSLQGQITTLQNSGGGSGGGGTLTLPISAGFIYTTPTGVPVAGTFGNNLVPGPGGVVNVSRAGFPSTLHPGVQNLPGAGLPQVLCMAYIHAGEAASYPANLVGSIIESYTSAGDTYVVTMYQNGVARVTYTWAPPHQGTGYFVPTVVSAAFSTATNDFLLWIGQAVPDAAISFIQFGLRGTLLG